MKRVNDNAVGRHALFILFVLIGITAILIILRAEDVANSNLEDAKRSDDVEYGLKRLRESEAAFHASTSIPQ